VVVAALTLTSTVPAVPPRVKPTAGDEVSERIAEVLV
jgi:hypothetical protein